MTALVNTETGEITESPTEDEVRASIRRVIAHAESIWDEWAWQVENQTWTVLGYLSWDEMRKDEYAALENISAPRAERPALVARFRGAGLTQVQTAATLGIAAKTVQRIEPGEMRGQRGPSKTGHTSSFSEDVVDAELVDDDEPTHEDGSTTWSHRVQTVSAECPIETLTDAQVEHLLGAATFLRHYCQGVLITRKAQQ